MPSGPSPLVRGFLSVSSVQYTNQIDAQSTAGALVYADSILAAASGGVAAPPWFAQALQLGLQPITTRLDDIDERLDGIDTCLDSIVTKIDQLMNFASQNHNRTLGDGRPVPFKPVPFPDGSMLSENDDVIAYLITCGKYTLTPLQTPTALTNLAVLDNLSYEELRAYCEGYYPVMPTAMGNTSQSEKSLFQSLLLHDHVPQPPDEACGFMRHRPASASFSPNETDDDSGDYVLLQHAAPGNDSGRDGNFYLIAMVNERNADHVNRVLNRNKDPLIQSARISMGTDRNETLEKALQWDSGPALEDLDPGVQAEGLSRTSRWRAPMDNRVGAGMAIDCLTAEAVQTLHRSVKALLTGGADVVRARTSPAHLGAPPRIVRPRFPDSTSLVEALGRSSTSRIGGEPAGSPRSCARAPARRPSSIVRLPAPNARRSVPLAARPRVPSPPSAPTPSCKLSPFVGGHILRTPRAAAPPLRDGTEGQAGLSVASHHVHAWLWLGLGWVACRRLEREDAGKIVRVGVDVRRCAQRTEHEASAGFSIAPRYDDPRYFRVRVRIYTVFSRSSTPGGKRNARHTSTIGGVRWIGVRGCGGGDVARICGRASPTHARSPIVAARGSIATLRPTRTSHYIPVNGQLGVQMMIAGA
ncbi:hypothetical protein B0H13DRAFT_1919732 [Mycena leptocephala]|nr:hypothetical protein B0H13DRAFT_1919732 [Mycena leptocephala]